MKKYIATCEVFSYEFTNNTYVLQGAIDCGAQAFTSAISIGCHDSLLIYPPAKIQLDGLNIQIDNNVAIARCLNERREGLKYFYDKTNPVDKALKKVIQKYHYPSTAEEVLTLFGVPEHLWKRNILQLGSYYPSFAAMDGLIKGTKVFTTKWYGQYTSPAFHVIDKISNALIKNDCIFLIPSSAKNKFNDNYIIVDMSTLFFDGQPLFSNE